MSTSEPNLVTLPGSHRDPVTRARRVGRATPETPVTLTVQLRLRDPERLAAKIEQPGYTPYTREEFLRLHAPREEDVAAVRAYVEGNGLTVTSVAPDRRTLTVTGPVAAAERAFHTELHAYESEGGEGGEGDRDNGRGFHAREGTLSTPPGVAAIVEGVFGLDTRPFARPQFVALPRPEAQAQIPGLTPLTAPQVARAYSFPAGDGSGQTIGIVELGGGYQDSDLQAYFSGLGLPTPQVIAVPVNGGANNPGGDPTGADGEVELDIEVSGAIAPAARIVVYFAKDASEQGFLDAVNAAVDDTTYKPSVVSISWGGPENGATPAARQAMDGAFQTGASLGQTFLCAAGDNGASDSPTATADTVDYPASSPYVTGCGGTALALANGAIAREVVWNETGHGATGGGISAAYPVPTWQQGVTLPPPAGAAGTPQSGGRGVPDVAGNADPFSGYTLRVDGQTTPIGGTSAVSPLWAGLIARINAAAGRPSGFLNPTLYAARGTGFHDITEGNNAVPPLPGYTAGPGWDACTGWGSPNGAQLAAVLAAPTGKPTGKA